MVSSTEIPIKTLKIIKLLGSSGESEMYMSETTLVSGTRLTKRPANVYRTDLKRRKNKMAITSSAAPIPIVSVELIRNIPFSAMLFGPPTQMFT